METKAAQRRRLAFHCSVEVAIRLTKGPACGYVWAVNTGADLSL